MIPILRSDIRARLEEQSYTLLVPREGRQMQRREAVAIGNIRISAQLEQDARRDLVALIHGPMQRRAAPAVRLVDRHFRPAEHVQQRPVIRRVRDGVQAAEALHVEQARVRAVPQEQVDRPHHAVPRGPLQWCGAQLPPDCVHFRALRDEVRAGFGAAVD